MGLFFLINRIYSVYTIAGFFTSEQILEWHKRRKNKCMSAAASLLANITVKSNTSCAFILALMVQPCLWLKTVTTLNKVSLDIFYEARWIILYTCMWVSLHEAPCTLAAMRPPRAGLSALTVGSIKTFYKVQLLFTLTSRWTRAEVNSQGSNIFASRIDPCQPIPLVSSGEFSRHQEKGRRELFSM